MLVGTSGNTDSFKGGFNRPLVYNSILAFRRGRGRRICNCSGIVVLTKNMNCNARHSYLGNAPRTNGGIIIVNKSGCHVNLNNNSMSSMSAKHCDDNVRLGTIRHTGTRVRGHTCGIMHTLYRRRAGPIISVRSRNSTKRMGYLSRLMRRYNNLVSVDGLPVNSAALSTGRVVTGRDRRHVNLLVRRRTVRRMHGMTRHRHTPVCMMNRAANSRHFTFRRTSNMHPFSLTMRRVFKSSPGACVISGAIRHRCRVPRCRISRLRRCLAGILRLRTITYGS